VFTHRDFCYWLQGLLELGNPEILDKEQVKTIKEHLDQTFGPFKKAENVGNKVEYPKHNIQLYTEHLDGPVFPLDLLKFTDNASC